MQADWQPTCSIGQLHLRAQLLGRLRQFFLDRSVLEVETPLLGQSVGTDPQLAFFTTEYISPPHSQALYLQTSPEFAMKRLLAAGSGSIFQICKAFRNNESGRYHNPEFSLLEWYRVGFDLNQLMDEITALISYVFVGHTELKPAQRLSYQTVFGEYTGLDPLVFCAQDYKAYALAEQLPEALALCADDHALWLDFLFSHCVQPKLGKNSVCLVYGYPACQSSLARLNQDDPRVTERVELFINGIELGNGYYELRDAAEQERRFDGEIEARKQLQLPAPVKDRRLIAALDVGLPDCSGMAIGLDRLLMLLADVAEIGQVLSFPIHRA